MLRPRALASCLLLSAVLFAPPPAAHAAAPDGNIEWNGLSHIGRLDRRPLCPVDGEAFAVRFQAYRGDLTAARVRAVQAGVPVTVEASVVGSRGLYDVWSASLPATGAAALVTYDIELRDGADLDYLSVNGASDSPPVDGGFVVDFATLSHAPVGATRVSGGGAVFKVWAPTRTTAHVRGDFNGWSLATPMTKQGEYFLARGSGVADRSQYKYFFNNAVWNFDARGRSINASSDRNTHLEDPLRYAWTSDAFVTPDAESLVVYQLHVGTFSGLNDPLGGVAHPSGYRAVGDRAAQLQQLGINCVQLSPVQEFPGDLSAGYNPVTQWAPEWRYGTPDDLKYMVDRLHAHGIAVTLDIVWNHFTASGNWMWDYDGSQQYFDFPTAIDTPWGAQADFDRAEVRDYYLHSALLWLEEYRLDGFRMDATSYMDIGAQAAAGWSLMQRMNDDIDRRRGEAFVVAEQLPNDAAISSSTAGGGAGFDAQYHMQFRDAIRGAVFAAGLGDPNMNAVRSALLGSGAAISGRRALNYFQLHDEAWPSSGGQRLVKTLDTTAPHDDVYAKGRMKLATGLLLTAPGVPALLQGDEWLESADFGVDAGNRIDWGKRTTYAGIYAYHQALIALRRTLAPLRASSSVYVSRVDEAANWLAFRRFDGAGNSVMVIASFANAPLTVRVGLPVAGAWSERVNSQDPAYMGSGPVNAGALASEPIAWDGFNQSVELQLPAMGLLVLSPLGTLEAPPVRAHALLLAAPSPNPAIGDVTLRFSLPAAGDARLSLHDVAGREVAELARGPHAAGAHAVRWDGRDAHGRAVAPGVYLARLVTRDGERVTRIARVR